MTATTISEQVMLNGGCERLLVCGGGSHNPLVMSRLAAHLPRTEVNPTDQAGISGDNMEALAFAWLAWRTLSGLPGNLPSVTGASDATILGAIYPANPTVRRSPGISSPVLYKHKSIKDTVYVCFNQDVSMKKLFMLFLPVLLSGCSYYHDIIERMHTNTQVWQCDGKPSG